MAYGTVKVDTIVFDNGGSDQSTTVSGFYRATTSGVTVSGTLGAAIISGVTVIGSTLVSGVTVVGSTTVSGATVIGSTLVSGATVIGSTTVSGVTVTGTTANFTSGNFSNLISAAATLSGALIITNQQQVQFREAIGNGVNYIALQAPASVSTDRVITLPDQTGTVVTTGDSGSVTSTMILDGTILNTDINTSAAIAFSKLANVSATDKLLGRSTAGAGAIEEITCTAAGRALIDDADAAAQRTTLGLAIGTDVQAFDADTAKTDVAQSFTAAQRGSITTLTDGATITPDFAVANNYSVTLAGNRTLANPTNLTAGQSGCIYITQDGTGSRTLAYGSDWDFGGGTVPTLTTTAAAVDVLAYAVRTTGSIAATLIRDVK
jgi:hypothetical protein